MPAINPATTVEGVVEERLSNGTTYRSVVRLDVPGLSEALEQFKGKRVVIYIEEAGQPEDGKGT